MTPPDLAVGAPAPTMDLSAARALAKVSAKHGTPLPPIAQAALDAAQDEAEPARSSRKPKSDPTPPASPQSPSPAIPAGE